jgi:hypothetical protein
MTNDVEEVTPQRIRFTDSLVIPAITLKIPMPSGAALPAQPSSSPVPAASDRS